MLLCRGENEYDDNFMTMSSVLFIYLHNYIFLMHLLTLLFISWANVT